MNAVRTQSERDVNAVVDDETRAPRSRNTKGFFGIYVKLSWAMALLAQLDEGRSAIDQARDLFGVRQAGEPRVRYGIQFWKIESQCLKSQSLKLMRRAHLLLLPPPLFREISDGAFQPFA